MRPVNLLPVKYRPRGSGADSRKAYLALGGLAALVIAVLMYVLAAKDLKDANSAIAATQAQVAAAEAQAVTLADFGDFAGIKQQRLTAVKSLATVRLDWERLFRELAHVLPERTWLTGFDGMSVGAAGMEAAEVGGPSGPSAKLQGCAATHSRIADLMVRLREIDRAKDVHLETTSRAPEGGTEAGAAGTSAASSGEASGAGGCGPYFSFEITVELEDAATAAAADAGQPQAVPASLGGGQ